ncbi:MAG: DUF4011 domain-containing protein, partial [Thermomicrobiales bacterium]
MKTVEQNVEDWRKQLLDLSKRNPLLNFRISTTRPTSIQLVEPGADEIFAKLIDGESLEIVADREDPGDYDDDLMEEVEPALEEGEPVSAEGERVPEEEPAPAPRRPLGSGQVRSGLLAERTAKV